MKPIKFEGHNRKYTAPDGLDCGDLYVKADENGSQSIWQLTPQELDDVAKSGKISLLVWAGEAHPPVGLEVVKPLADEVNENAKAPKCPDCNHDLTHCKNLACEWGD